MENYFNYFTEIEEQFRKCRSEAVLLSPLDWALIESWKEQGFPLPAVLLGIERSFEKHRAGKRTYRKVNSLAYCSQEVFRAVEESRTQTAQSATPGVAHEATGAPFSAPELAGFFARGATALENAAQQAGREGQQVLAGELAEAVAALRTVADQVKLAGDMEEIERNLTALEDKLYASLMRGTPVEVLSDLRAEVERGLVPYRRKMPAAEVDLLERRFLKSRLLERYRIPRLSLFYL